MNKYSLKQVVTDKDTWDEVINPQTLDKSFYVMSLAERTSTIYDLWLNELTDADIAYAYVILSNL